MLFVKNHRIYTRSVSFALPENMSIVTDPEHDQPDCLILESADGQFTLEIFADDVLGTPKDLIQEVVDSPEFVVHTEPFPIERGGMNGYAAYYGTEDDSESYYEEFLQYPMNDDGQSILNICICRVVIEGKETIETEAFVEQPNIKSFFDSIRYEPEVCSRVIGSC